MENQLYSKDKINLIPIDQIATQIYLLRGQNLNEQVKRNRDRFPGEFMFQLTSDKFDRLRSQFAISNIGRGGRRYPPFAFSEHGVAMLSSVLDSKRAIAVNIQIIRTFIKLRQTLVSHKSLAHKLELLEKKYDAQFKDVFDAIRKLMAPTEPKSQRRLGFRQNALKSQIATSKRGLEKP